MRLKEGGPHHFLSLDARERSATLCCCRRQMPQDVGDRLRLPTAAAWRRAQRAVWLLEQPRHVQRRQWPYRPIVNALRGALKNNEGADRNKMGPIAEALRGHRERREAIRPYLICSLLYETGP
jgi:hypothetical protein